MGARSTRNTTQNNRSDGHLLEYFRKSFLRGGGGTNAPPPPEGLTATGGVISDYTDGPAVYRAHVFTSTGTFTVSATGTGLVEYLVVAGGGGGGGTNGGYASGGGGAGGFRTNVAGHPLACSAFPVSATPGVYPVSVGAGGAGAPAPNEGPGARGGDSVFGSITSTGGGGGIRVSPEPFANTTGGSGGGSYNNNTPGAAGNTPPTSPPQGNPGGTSSPQGGGG